MSDEPAKDDPQGAAWPGDAGAFLREVSEFLVERCRVPPTCPLCGHDQWTVTLPPPEGGYVTCLPIKARSDRLPEEDKRVALDVAFVTCTNCGFMRIHSLDPFRTWARERGNKDAG